jgi:SAM-dependent methyltransferase
MKHIPTNKKITRLVGFDTAGEVFIQENHVFRGIYKNSGELYREILKLCHENHLFSLGIVKTSEVEKTLNSNLDYEILFEHERVDFITYPHEWTSTMLKDAAMFHLDLFINLSVYGIILKDWHPYNILFQGTNPIFVDFTSLIPFDKICDQDYLSPPSGPGALGFFWNRESKYIFEMYRRMHAPFFLLPLYLMHAKHHMLARNRLYSTSLNTSPDQIRDTELRDVSQKCYKDYGRYDLLKRLSLALSQRKTKLFWRLNRFEINRLDVSPQKTSYLNYYSEKNEELEFFPSQKWSQKQHVVHSAITELKPHTLMDLGCNTGWFSILAAKCGCHVVAIDIDESCSDKLYQTAKKEKLNILPLVIDFRKFSEEAYPLSFENEPSRSLISGQFPLLYSVEKRLKCDMVIALAIVHHLTLGYGLSFDHVIQKLSALSRKYLIVEFVDINDKLILGEPEFFKAFHTNATSFHWYNLENLIKTIERYFSDVKVNESSTDSRKLLICSRLGPE